LQSYQSKTLQVVFLPAESINIEVIV